MKIFVTIVMLLFGGLLFGQEIPDTEMPIDESPGLSVPSDYAVSIHYSQPEPASVLMEKMPLKEKENANLEISSLLQGTPYYEKAIECEYQWNKGNFSQAIALLEEIENSYPPLEFSFSWKKPIRSEPDRWGTDVRVGSVDSVYVNKLVYDNTTGHIFAVLLLEYNGGSNTMWTVHMSTDRGTTWSALYSWGAGYRVNDISAEIQGDYLYVAFSRGANEDQILLYRFATSTGTRTNFADGSSFQTVLVTNADNPVLEVSASSNHDFYNNRLYVTAITGNEQLRFLWFNPADETWTEIATNITDASYGLATGTNEGFSGNSGRYMFASYYTSTDSIKIAAVNIQGWETDLFKMFAGSSSSYNSAISAYHDTIICAFDYHVNTPVVSRYEISYNGGNTWYYGYISTSDTTAETGDITARGGAGLAATYRHYTSPRQLRFVHRNYPSGAWDSPQNLSDIQPYYNQSSIAYMGNNQYGVLYLSWNSPVVRGAYFDKTSLVTSIKDQTESIINGFTLDQNYPNPFNPSTTISYSLHSPQQVRLEIFNALGQKVDELVNGLQAAGPHNLVWDASRFTSGIYFYKLTVQNRSQTRRMLLIK